MMLNPDPSDNWNATIDAICDRFEAAWAGHESPRIEDYVSAAHASLGHRLTSELLLAEWDLRRRGGEQLESADFLCRFPDHDQLIHEHLDGHDVDNSSAAVADTRGLAKESDGRLSVRCPKCNTSLELVVDASFTEIECSDCGNCFSLVDDQVDQGSFVAGAKIGHFTLLKKVGMGGFGIVWKARDEQLDRTVAIKIPIRGRLHAIEVEQFLREARSAAQLRHPNIVGIHEVGRDGETVYIVSDFIEGAVLSDYVDGRRLSSREVVSLCITTAEALQHAHDHGVIHRDLKPSNIIIDGQGKPHLTDFGLARRDAGDVTMTRDGHLLGTPAYMSPELAQGKAHQADRRSDVYSLGVLLFQLLTSELPFRGTVHTLVQQIVHEEPPSPRKLDRSIARDLETICLKCLEKQPRHRYESSRHVADELRRYLDDQPIVARPASQVARAFKLCRRNPLATALSGALVLAILCGITGVSYQWFQARMESELFREASYVNGIAKIAEALESGTPAVTSNLLNRHVPQRSESDLRGFEWYYLWNRFQPSLHAETLNCGSHFAIFAMTTSPDGRLVAAAGGPGTVLVWDLHKREILHRFEQHEWVVLDLAFSPNSQVLVSASGDRRACLWNMGTGEFIKELQNQSAAYATYFSSVDLLAVGGSQGVRIWDVADLHNLVETCFIPSPSRVSSAKISPDGFVLCGCHDGVIRVWDLATKAVLPPFQEQQGHTAQVEDLDFSPDGETLVSGSVDKTVRLWDIETREPLHTFEGHTAWVTSVSFAPDGKRIASASRDGTAIVWDVASGERWDTIRGHDSGVWAVEFGTDSETLFTGGADGTIKVWDLSTRTRQVTLPGNDGPYASPIAFDSTGQRLVTAHGSNVTVWDLSDGATLSQYSGQGEMIYDVECSPTESAVAIATANETVIWDWTADKVIRKLDSSGPLAFSADGTTLATCSNNRSSVQLWGLASGRCRELTGVGMRLDCLAFSPDDMVLAAGGSTTTSRNLLLWDTRTLKEIAAPNGHKGRVASVAFSPIEDIVAAAGFDGRILLWDAKTGEELDQQIEGRHVMLVNSLDFSRDGRTLASGSLDGAIKFWHVDTGGHLLTIKDHTETVGSVVFGHDGNREVLASSSTDGTIRLWPAAVSEELEQAGW